MLTTLAREAIEAFVGGDRAHPFSILGPHHVEHGSDKHLIIRALIPGASKAKAVVKTGGKTTQQSMALLHPEGLFEAVFPNFTDFSYLIHYTDASEQEHQRIDPYTFRDLLSDYDLHLLAEGTHHRSYEKLGAHVQERKDVRGTLFAVWAPNARSVSIIGDFNQWEGLSHPMEFHESTGIWQLFIPELSDGSLYKYLIRFRNEGFEQKIDPYGFYFEETPRTAAVVFNLQSYDWKDDEWMLERKQRNALNAPLAIYEVHLGSWKRVPEENHRSLTYRELASQLVPYVKDLGFTHIELLPITEHPLSASWGYQTTGYYAPTSRYGNPDDFRFFVDTCHQNGLGVILDWVPAHFPRDLHALASFDGTHLYEHADPRQGSHPDWGTLIFNYGRAEVANFLLSNALFWLDKYHLDGLRVDAVASMLYLDYSRQSGEWIPNRYGGNENLEAIQFLKRFNELVHHYYPGVLTIGEESTAWPGVSRSTYLGGLGFSLKWNMGWMHDSLLYISKDPVHRKYHHNNLTFSLLYAFTENFVLPLSHDEVVHGKGALLSRMPGDLWQKFANLRSLYGYMYGHPGKKLLFMGGEFGHWSEWNFDASLEWRLLQWQNHWQLQNYVRDLNRLYRREPALHQVDFDWTGFDWIDFHDADSSVIAFLRKSHDPANFVVVICNFTPVPRCGYRLGVPHSGYYCELLNSDSEAYGGSNMGNGGGVPAEAFPWQGHPCSICLTLPPLATLILGVRDL